MPTEAEAPPGSPRARTEWAHRVAAEYTSAALAAQVLQWGIRFGLPRPLLDTAHRVVSDELDHAALSHACLVALGGGRDPVELDEGGLAAGAARPDPLVALVDTILESFCFGETLAVPLFGAMRATTTAPAAVAALDRILRDEAVHRAFGWQALDALLALDRDGVADRVAAQLPAVTARFHAAYGATPDGPPLTADERAFGLLEPAAYREIFARTVHGDIASRLSRRGLPTPPGR